MTIEAVSSYASSFPTVEVEYDDLLALRHRMGGRGTDGTVDCLGLLLLLYRRAGLGIPDPKASGGDLEAFLGLFEVVEAADTLYDVAWIRKQQGHLMTLIRPGLLISAKSRTGVYTQRVNHVKAIDGVSFWRLKDAVLP